VTDTMIKTIFITDMEAKVLSMGGTVSMVEGESMLCTTTRTTSNVKILGILGMNEIFLEGAKI